MATAVDIPDIGIVEFPDSMSQEEIITESDRLYKLQQKRAALRAEFAKAKAEGERAETIGNTIRNVESVIFGLAHPIKNVERATEQTASAIAGQPLALQVKPSEILETPVATIPQIPQQEGTGKQIAAGSVNAIIDFANFFLTPEGVATLGIGALPKSAQRAVVGAFATSMAVDAPQQLQQAAEAANAGDLQAAAKHAMAGGGEALLAGTMTRHALERPVIKETLPDQPAKADLSFTETAVVNAEQNNAPLTAQAIKETHASEIKTPEPVHADVPAKPGEVPKTVPVAESGERVQPTPAEEAPLGPGVVGMGGAVPAEFERPPQTPTSIKNATVDAERQERGLPPAMQPARRTFGQVWDEVTAQIDADATVQDRLINELREKPRALTDAEDAMLLHRQIDLQNEHAKAMRDLAQARDDGRLMDVESENLRVQAISDQLLDLYNIGKKVGTETGRGLAARRMMAYEDFSLAKMEMEKRAANEGAPLTDAQRGEIAELHKRIEETQRKYDEYVAKAEEEARQRAIQETISKAPQPDPYIIQLAERLVGKLDKRAEAARERLRKRMGTTAAGVDPTVLVDLAEIGAAHIGHVGLDVTKWTARMIEDVGEWSREYLDDVFKRSQALLEAEVAASEKPGDVRKRLTKKDKETGDALGTALKEKVAAGERNEIGQIVQKIARSFVELGITEREALIDAVHAELQQYLPDITRRETMDAISGYGDFKALTKDDISVKLRDLKGQMQQVGKLEDMTAGTAPKKTGLERRTPSDEERQLIKQVNELKKRGGFTVTDPAKQLKSALDAIKTRLQHQITDLSLQIANRQQTVPQRRTVALDAEAAELKTRRDELKKEYDDIFGKRELSDEKRVEMATKAVERSIADYEKRLGEGDLPARRPKRATPSTPALEALRARRDALREELQELRDLAKPKRTPEQIALQTLKTRLKNETARLTEKLAAGDFAPKPKRIVTLDTEATALKLANEKAKRQFREGLMKDRLAKRSLGRKIFDRGVESINLARALMTSFDLSAVLRQGGFVTFAHPVRAAKVFPAMFRALKSEKGQLQIDQELLARKNYPLYQRAGLYLSEHGQPLAKLEEAYMSRWADKIPGISHSQRAYTTFLNVLRADSFDAMAESIARKGTLTEAEGKAIANFINVATGRGKIGLTDNAAVGLNTVFFAPRLVASRFQLLLGQPFYRGSAATRKLIAAEYARTLGGLAVVYALASMAGSEVETDPRSSDFGKLKFGDTRVDPLMGLGQNTVLLSRLTSGEMKDLRERITAIRGEEVPFGKSDAADIISKFLRTKLAPVPSAAVNVATGKNVVGEEVTPLSTAIDLTIPLSFRDIYDVMQEHGIPAGTALELLSLLGMSVQHYEE